MLTGGWKNGCSSRSVEAFRHGLLGADPVELVPA